jgi:hypothetical protein
MKAIPTKRPEKETPTVIDSITDPQEQKHKRWSAWQTARLIRPIKLNRISMKVTTSSRTSDRIEHLWRVALT